jgi:lipoprotein signal peptidase
MDGGTGTPGLLLAAAGLLVLGVACVACPALRRLRGMSFLWAGGVSNFIDRVARGCVVDWVQVWGLGVNLADLWLCVGCLLAVASAVEASRRR